MKKKPVPWHLRNFQLTLLSLKVFVDLLILQLSFFHVEPLHQQEHQNSNQLWQLLLFLDAPGGQRRGRRCTFSAFFSPEMFLTFSISVLLEVRREASGAGGREKSTRSQD